MPTRERYVWICTNRRPDGHPKGSCAERGADALKDKLKIAVADAGLAGRVRVMHSGCLDLCEHGVALAAMPDDLLLGAVTEADVPTLVRALGAATPADDEGLRVRSLRDPKA
ncbi:MAG: (2Fe-2S) ferredoxin domain-containing protein [Polyangiales bacterium]